MDANGFWWRGIREHGAHGPDGPYGSYEGAEAEPGGGLGHAIFDGIRRTNRTFRTGRTACRIGRGEV